MKNIKNFNQYNEGNIFKKSSEEELKIKELLNKIENTFDFNNLELVTSGSIKNPSERYIYDFNNNIINVDRSLYLPSGEYDTPDYDYYLSINGKSIEISEKIVKNIFDFFDKKYKYK